MKEKEIPFTLKRDNAMISVDNQGVVTISAPEIRVNQELSKCSHQS